MIKSSFHALPDADWRKTDSTVCEFGSKLRPRRARVEVFMILARGFSLKGALRDPF